MKKFIVFCIIVCSVFILYSLYKMEILENFQRVHTSEFLEESVAKNAYSNNQINEITQGKNKSIQSTLMKRKEEKSRFLVGNGIEVQTLAMNINEVDKVVKGTFPKVVGLLDNKTEKKINDLIINDFKQEIIKLIKSIPGSNFNGNTFNIWLNSNNILCFTQDISYTIGSQYYHFEKGFVYNLPSSKKLTLGEVFIKDIDYIGLLNKLVVEDILKNSMEEEWLNAPFSTINEDQNYYISEDKLTLLFLKGTSGFAKNIQISIPLWKIDDYITVMDAAPSSSFPLYVKEEYILKRNNIQYETRHFKIEKEKYNLSIEYPEFLSYCDKDTLKLLNIEMDKRVKYLQTIKHEVKLDAEHSINGKTNFVIKNSIYCNSYGKISIVETIKGGSYPANEISNVLFFDLIKKRELDTNSLIRNYIKKVKTIEKNFVNKVNMSLNEEFLRYSTNIRLKQTIKLNLDNILDNGIIYFGDKDMTLHFNKSYISVYGKGINIGINIDEVFGKSLEELLQNIN